jgi:hypothetical protein
LNKIAYVYKNSFSLLVFTLIFPFSLKAMMCAVSTLDLGAEGSKLYYHLMVGGIFCLGRVVRATGNEICALRSLLEAGASRRK